MVDPSLLARYTDTLTDQNLKPLNGAQITVSNGDGTLATLYDSLGNPLTGANPFFTGVFGLIDFYAMPAVYGLRYIYGGRIIRDDEQIVGSPPEFKGDTGTSDSAFLTLAELKASDPTLYPSPRLAAKAGGDGGIANGPFTYREGNFTGLEGQNIVALDAVPITQGALIRNDPRLNVGDFGFSPTATPQANLAALKLAISAAQVGSVLFVPPSAPLRYRVDTSDGLSAAAVIGKRLTLQIDGDIQAYYAVGGNPAPTPIKANPAFMLRVTSPGVTITGNGRIYGDGTINDVNAGTDETMPGMIRVEADRFAFSGVTIDTPPKIGIHLYGCKGARIGGTFMGGPLKYSDTAYFQIRAIGGSGHSFSSRFVQGADGGRTVQCIFLNTTNACKFTNVQAEAGSFYEKVVYGFGDYNIYSGGTILGDPGFVPGTNLKGCVTLPIRFHGNYNSVNDVTVVGCAGGAQLMDGVGNSVRNSRFINCGQTAVSLYNSSLSRAAVTNVVATCGNLPGFLISSGIYLAANAGSKYVSVSSNTVTGFSVDDPIANIATWQPNTAYPGVALVKPTVGNGRYYAQTGIGGTSGATEPAWPTTPGSTVTDGTGNTWVAVAYAGNQAEITILGAGAGTDAISYSRFCNNNTAGGRNGLYLGYVVYSKIAGNKFDCTLWGMSENNGSYNVFEWNDVLGTDNTGVQNLANTSTYLNYRKGSWTPSQGVDLIVSGTFSSTGSFEQNGRTVTYRGEVSASGSVAMTSPGKLTNLPVVPVSRAAGSILTTGLGGGNCGVLPASDNSALFSTVVPSAGSIIFSITYEGSS